MKYSELLKDPRWQKKRLEIFERDQWTCTNCFSSTYTLCVHHIIYNGKPWEVPNKFLVTLCEKCHDEEEHLKIVGIKATIDFVVQNGMTHLQIRSILQQLACYYKLIDNPDSGTFIDIWSLFEVQISDALSLKKELDLKEVKDNG